MLRNRLDIQLRNVCLIFRVYGWLQSLSGPPGPPLHPPWNPGNIQLSQGTGQGVSRTFNAASRLRSLEDRSAALGSRRCELPGMHSVPKSAVLPYASGVGGLSRRLLNKRIHPVLIPRLKEPFLFLSRQRGALSFLIKRWICLVQKREGHVVSH